MYDCLLVTGGCGFIGSHFVRMTVRERLARKVVNVDLLTYAGNLANLAELRSDSRHVMVRADIADTEAMDRVVTEHRPDAIVNFAAESHVDRSIIDPAAFVRTNVLGTSVLLQASRKHRIARFLQVSTDEVYGSLDESAAAFTESTPLAPRSPYSASKASADLLTLAFHHTYGLPALVTRASNNYGSHQFPEKLIPLATLNVLRGEPIPVYGDGRNVRDWLHVEDHCRGLHAALAAGRAGEVYNFGGGAERRNIDVALTILRLLKRPESMIRYVTDRPGHDWRYAVDSTKATTELGWQPQRTFEEALAETLRWYSENAEWCTSVIDGGYLAYYEQQYGR
jgi:dTDP-glucose 4,6-dehydratase